MGGGQLDKLSDREWRILAEAADILERHGHHDASAAVFQITQER